MKKLNQNLLMIIIIVTIFSCDFTNEPEKYKYPLSLKPIVAITNYNYDTDSLFNKFARPKICSEFLTEYYSKYNDTIKGTVFNEVKRKIDSLKLNMDSFTKSYQATNLEKNYENVIPVYFEKSKFNGKDVWNISAVYGRNDDLHKLTDVISFSVESETYKVHEIQDYLPLKPIVRITSDKEDSTTVVNKYFATEIWDKFRKKYNNCSTYKTRQKIIENIYEQLPNLKINKNDIDKCFNLVGVYHNYWIPCLIEKIEYNGKTAWTIVYIWGAFTNLAHIRFYIIDANEYIILYETGCL